MPKNQNLFKEAIAEAKTIRQLALENAKDSISQSITPHLKELLAAKLQEMEEEDEDVLEKDMYEEEEEVEDESPEEEEVEDEDDPDEDDHDEDEDHEDEEEQDVEDMSVKELRDLIRDVIAQEMPAPERGPDTEIDIDLDDEEIPADDMVGPEDGIGDEEEIDLSELMAELDAITNEADHGHEDDEVEEAKEKEHDSVDEKKYSKKEKEMEEDLSEALNTIDVLKAELAEVNLLNSKLLYLNKLMKANNLTESQKAKVITTFDKAETAKEAKLVYETFKESLSNSTSNTKKSLKEHVSFASKSAGPSTKPKKPVDTSPELNENLKRMQKLAGIIKN